MLRRYSKWGAGIQNSGYIIRAAVLKASSNELNDSYTHLLRVQCERHENRSERDNSYTRSSEGSCGAIGLRGCNFDVA